MAVADRQTVYEFAGYRLDPRRRRLLRPDGSTALVRAKVFDTLLFLVGHAGELVTKAELIAAVWPDAVVEENNLNQAISILRQVFEDDRHTPRFIATVTGRGYQFVAPVEIVAAPPGTPGGRVPAPRKTLVVIAAVTVLAIAGISLYVVPDGERQPLPDARFTPASATLITDFPGSHSAPTLSPDGTLMAFASDASGSSQVWVKSLGQGLPVQITHGERPATSPSWSPTTDEIIFQRTDAEGRSSIWVVDALGTSEPRLLVENGIDPEFSWDGQSFVYSLPNRSLVIADRHGGKRHTVDGLPSASWFAPRTPAISRDGVIAFVHAPESPSADIWTIAAAGGEARQLTHSEDALRGVWAQTPTWMPDGRTLIYAAAPDGAGNSHLWHAAADGSSAEQITTGVGSYRQPVVSRDGRHLIYTHSRPVWRLMRTNPETGIHVPVYESRNFLALPLVSPDGRSVVFFGAQIYSIAVDGTGLRQRTFDEPESNLLPAWSADGRWIYFYRDNGLHRLSVSEGQSSEVLPGFNYTSRNWHTVHGSKLAFHEFGIEPGIRRAWIRNLESGTAIELPEPLQPTAWSQDGESLLGFSAQDRTIMICPATGAACNPVSSVDGPIRGLRPRWSSDESRIFFRRISRGRPEFGELWVVDRNGSNERMLFEFGPYQARNIYFGVAHDDSIIWNQYDRLGAEEIWKVSIDRQ